MSTIAETIPPHPDWQLYRSFLAAVREGSLSGAARALGLTQPTLGRHIDSLETALRVKLFTRSLDGLVPTEAAQRLLGPVETMASAAEAAQRAVSARAGAASGTVRITASEIMGGEVLPGLLVPLRAAHPDLAVELTLTNRNEDLLRGDADIAVRMVRPTQRDLVARSIGRVDIGLFAHRRYLKAHGAPRDLAEVAGHTLIGYDRDPLGFQLLQRWKVPLGREAFAIRCDNDLAQVAALRSGLGIGALHLGIARRDRQLVPVLQPALLFQLDMWLVMHRDHRGLPRVQVAFDHLAQQLAAYAASSRLA